MRAAKLQEALLDTVIPILAWNTLISATIMGGVYFAFSTFMMPSLDALGSTHGMEAMQSINKVIVRSLFLPVFFVGTLTSAAVAVVGLYDMGRPGAVMLVAGGALYFFGMFVVTVVGNVPLNNALENEKPGSQAGDVMWLRYLAAWVRWNHVRTLSCLASTICLVSAIDRLG